MFGYRLSLFPFPLLAMFSPFPQTEKKRRILTIINEIFECWKHLLHFLFKFLTLLLVKALYGHFAQVT